MASHVCSKCADSYESEYIDEFCPPCAADIAKSHTKVAHGLCDVCHHYGDDCTGNAPCPCCRTTRARIDADSNVCVFCEADAVAIVNRIHEDGPPLSSGYAVLAYCQAVLKYEKFLRGLEASGGMDPGKVDSAIFAINKVTQYLSDQLDSLKRTGSVAA